MCLAVPAQLVKVNGYIGTIELGGVRRDCSLMLVSDAKVGDWVLVHAGCAVQIVDENEAKATIDAFQELEEREQAYDRRQSTSC
ncbi:MAG: HypC/HybG/HupF family hydrogenase formation chaperone [Veillonellaceae bacterium]|nr:HypC/HybG/HupF family hydrogenase formation chaperone [Veillonellaceae bacterium]